MSLENRVLSEAFYVARLLPEWRTKPFWLMRRCVVPYVASRQFMVLHKNDLPVAFVGWVWEGVNLPRPWRLDNYLPSASDFLLSSGHCCVTELMSPLVPAPAVMEKVSKWLKLDTIPTRIEVNGERKIVAIHEATTAMKNVSISSPTEGYKS
jgi:hemolysin-activating ACP:hemolysin acyltransferase